MLKYAFTCTVFCNGNAAEKFLIFLHSNDNVPCRGYETCMHQVN